MVINCQSRQTGPQVIGLVDQWSPGRHRGVAEQGVAVQRQMTHLFSVQVQPLGFE